MTLFWAVALGLAATAAALMAAALLRGGQDRRDTASDVDVYRDQLDEVARDLARGTIAPDEAERVRVEVSRRLLEADRRGVQATHAAPRGATLAAATLATVAVVGGGAALYWWMGAPGYPDLGIEARIAASEAARTSRPDQATAEAQAAAEGLLPPATEPNPTFVDLMERLRAAMSEGRGDLQGWRLLARNEAALGNYAAAVDAQESLIAALGDGVRAIELAQLADLMVMAAGGYVSPEAEAALDRALALDPRDGTARYYKGLAHLQVGRPDLAFGIWEPLLRQSTPDAPWVAPITAQMPEVAELAGVRWTPPELRGPSAEDMAAAEDMTPQERMEMISGMVAGLAERLSTEGGPAQDWARLISAYGVLGRHEAAASVWREAQEVFGANAEAMAILRRAAEEAGVAGVSE
ncbi:c-type cytochrome biogenesis protein CcmI [Rhodobacteraceae bacterium CCMM004]|nr:c-type cytochrome biogenesis protein CcmI [Rhodobacteraceae bacterium CCMM004]